jgi:hypothetical protein
VAHETGHAVEQNFGMYDEILKALGRGLTGSARRGDWEAWAEESFADLWGTLTLGPAFVNSLMDFLADDPNKVNSEVSAAKDKYPTSDLRIRLCLRVLERMGFDKVAETLTAEWGRQYGRDGMPAGYAQDAAAVADAVLDASFSSLGGAGPLLNLPNLRFKADDDNYSLEGADERGRGRPAKSANTVRRLVAAARHLYDQEPQVYVDKECNKGLICDAQGLIKPGTRTGERKLKEAEKKKLGTVSEEAGSTWFAEFKKWANPTSVGQGT